MIIFDIEYLKSMEMTNFYYLFTFSFIDYLLFIIFTLFIIILYYLFTFVSEILIKVKMICRMKHEAVGD